MSAEEDISIDDNNPETHVDTESSHVDVNIVLVMQTHPKTR